MLAYKAAKFTENLAKSAGMSDNDAKSAGCVTAAGTTIFTPDPSGLAYMAEYVVSEVRREHREKKSQ